MTKILIVDEDTDVLRLLRVKLGGAGYEVSRARDGQEALSLAASVQPDVVVAETLLGDIDGLELVARLRQITAPAPIVIALSGQHSDEDIAAALVAGADDFVAKPFSPTGLLERIRVNVIRTGVASPTGKVSQQRG